MWGVEGCIRGHQGVSGVYWGLAGSVGTHRPEGYRWHKGGMGSSGMYGVLGPLGGVRGVLGAGRECMYSGPEGA